MPLSMVVCVLFGVAEAADPRDQVPESDGYVDTFAIGAGAIGAVDRELDVGLPTGVAWTARYGWFVGKGLQWEFSYLGAREPQSLLTVLESGLKLDVLPQSKVHPFVGAGIGFATVTAAGQARATPTVPVHGGLELDLGNLVLGPRLTARPPVLGELAGNGLTSWALTADLASRF